MDKILKSKFEKAGIRLSDEQCKQFQIYFELLIEWNEVMNLTTITDYEQVVQKHFIDSIEIAKFLDINTVKNVMDVGTGAGFPGIPLKIVFPQLNVTLLDSLHKRVRFLNTVIEKNGLSGIVALHGRAEDYARKEEYREKFDLCVSRAVANLSTLSEYCIPYVKVDGMFVSYKAGNIEEEIFQSKSAVSLLGGKIKEVVKFQLSDTDIDRSFIMIQKEKHISNKYPRKAGLPSKEPLFIS